MPYEASIETCLDRDGPPTCILMMETDELLQIRLRLGLRLGSEFKITEDPDELQ